MKYDYLIVGSGLFGAVCAHELTKQGKRCLVVEKRNQNGDKNIYFYDGNNIFGKKDCLESIKTDDSYVILLTPSGKVYNQKMAYDLSNKKIIPFITHGGGGKEKRW